MWASDVTSTGMLISMKSGRGTPEKQGSLSWLAAMAASALSRLVLVSGMAQSESCFAAFVTILHSAFWWGGQVIALCQGGNLADTL